MFGIPTLDLVVIAVYSLLMVAIGLIAMLRIKNQEDFFLGGRRFGKVLQIFASFGQATSTETAVGTVTTTYRDGAGGIWSQLPLLWATPFYWFTAPWYRRMRLLTFGDFFRERFQSRSMAMMYSAVASFYLVIIIALGLKALSFTVLGITIKPESELNAAERIEYASSLRLEALTQKNAAGTLTAAETEELRTLQVQQPRREFSHVNEALLIWFIVAIVLIYGIAGGLEAAVWTDTVQGTLILVLSVLLVPFAVMKLNVLHGTSGFMEIGRILHQELPGYFFSPVGSALNADFTWYFVVALCVMTSLNVAVQANQFTANASAKDEFTAAVGFTVGTFIKRYCTVAWGFVALLCYALYSREIQNSDLVWGHATRDLLGGLGIGLVGLMIACLLAALQSTASTLMLSGSSLFTKNVYQPLFPGRTESHYVLVGRICGTAVLVVAALLCTAFSTILEMLKFLWEFNAIVAATFWCGLKWRRANRTGAWASIGSSLVLFIVLPLGLPAVFPQLRSTPALLQTTQERIVQQEYTATQRDVNERQQQIANWRGNGPAPAPLQEGDLLTRASVVPPKSIYWSQGLEMVGGEPRGRGMLNIEMYVFGLMFDLNKNPHALNETIRYTYKILLPFLVLIIVSWLTRPTDNQEVQRFFLRMRTPVRLDRDEDERALAAAYANPEATRATLLFPNSNLEFFKWDRVDTIGFALSCLVMFGVLALLWAILNFGA